MPAEYAYEMDGDFNRQRDFDARVDVIPVSDPNAATMSQRIMQYQAALQLSQQAPQLYDMGKLHRQMLEVLGIQDASDIIKLPDDIKPADPVTENMMMLKQEPVKAFKYQDHEAHISVHMAAMQDPKMREMWVSHRLHKLLAKQWRHMLQNMLHSSIAVRLRKCLVLKCQTKISRCQKT